jgi:hypothetical protein
MGERRFLRRLHAHVMGFKSHLPHGAVLVLAKPQALRTGGDERLIAAVDIHVESVRDGAMPFQTIQVFAHDFTSSWRWDSKNPRTSSSEKRIEPRTRRAFSSPLSRSLSTVLTDTKRIFDTSDLSSNRFIKAFLKRTKIEPTRYTPPNAGNF